MFIATVFVIAKNGQQLRCPSTNELINGKNRAKFHDYNSCDDMIWRITHLDIGFCLLFDPLSYGFRQKS